MISWSCLKNHNIFFSKIIQKHFLKLEHWVTAEIQLEKNQQML